MNKKEGIKRTPTYFPLSKKDTHLFSVERFIRAIFCPPFFFLRLMGVPFFAETYGCPFFCLALFIAGQARHANVESGA